MYSGDLFLVNSMQLNHSKRDPSSIKDIRLDVSHDPNVFIKNLNHRFHSEKIEWEYNDLDNRVIVNTNDNAYVLQIPMSLGIMLGCQNSDVSFQNEMVANHTFKSDWFYNVLLTPKFIDVMKNKNNTSIYELLGQNDFPVKGFFMLQHFFNELSNSHCTPENYGLAHKVYNSFNCKNLYEFTILYNHSDTLLLDKIMFLYRQIIQDNFKIDVNHF